MLTSYFEQCKINNTTKIAEMIIFRIQFQSNLKTHLSGCENKKNANPYFMEQKPYIN